MHNTLLSARADEHLHLLGPLREDPPCRLAHPRSWVEHDLRLSAAPSRTALRASVSTRSRARCTCDCRSATTTRCGYRSPPRTSYPPAAPTLSRTARRASSYGAPRSRVSCLRGLQLAFVQAHPLSSLCCTQLVRLPSASVCISLILPADPDPLQLYPQPRCPSFDSSCPSRLIDCPLTIPALLSLF